MKIVFISSRGFDYAQDLTYAGLDQSTQIRSLYDQPWNPKFHLPFWRYPKNLGYRFSLRNPLSTLNSAIRACDVVIVGAAKRDAFITLLSCIKRIPVRSPLILIDGGDSAIIAGDLCKDDSLNLYEKAQAIREFDLIFKREMLLDRHYPINVLPYPLSFSSNLHHAATPLTYQVAFWGVESHPIRSKALELLKGQFDCDQNGTASAQSFSAYNKRGLTYLNELARCKVVLSLRGVGHDTLRFWEVLALGRFMLAQRIRLNMNHPPTPFKHFVPVEDDLQDLLEKCNYYLSHETKREAIAKAGHSHFIRYHSISRRIEYMLSRINSLNENHSQKIFSFSAPEIASNIKVCPPSFQTPIPEQIKRIGVIMYGLLGDTLIRTPFLRELRKIYPNAQITAILDPIGYEAIDLTGCCDHFIVVDRKKRFLRLDLYRRVQHLFRIRASNFDLLIDLYMSKSSELVMRFSNAKYKIFGYFTNPKCCFDGVWSNYIPRYQFKNERHYGISCLKTLSFLTEKPVNLSTQPYLDVARLNRLSLPISKIGPSVSEPFFLVSLGAGDTRKIPDTKVVAALCQFIYKSKGYLPVVALNPEQEFLQSNLSLELASMNVSSHSLEALTLEKIACLMLRSKLVVVPDSGFFHLAIGLNVNTLAFFTYTNPELVRPENNNCTILFKPNVTESPVAGAVTTGTGTPPIDEVLSVTTEFLRAIDK
jgi:ADP-heptose:LPS heptosyltransferase